MYKHDKENFRNLRGYFSACKCHELLVGLFPRYVFNVVIVSTRSNVSVRTETTCQGLDVPEPC